MCLASAVRDTVAARGVNGRVTGTELEPAKVEHACATLRKAGLPEWVEVREGDLREALLDVPEPVDLVLVDTWFPMSLPALEVLLPALRSGALVVSGAKEYAAYLALVRDPAGPFRSVTVPEHGGLEISLVV